MHLPGLTLLFAIAASAQPPAWQSEVDQVFERWFEDDSPGVMLSIVQNDRIVYQQAYGMANIEAGIEHGPDILFNVASVSKQFTAAAVGLLALEGKLDLDADIRTLLPYVPDYGEVITVRQLVHHTSGLPDLLGIVEDRDLQFKDGWGNSDVLPLLNEFDQLDFEPGEKFDYSNTNYILLAEIVQSVSGESLRQFTDRRIFQPLGMETARVDDNLDHLDDDNVAQSYERRRGQYVHVPRDDYLVGDGNVVVSVNDFAKWSANFHHGKVGGDRLIDLITTPGRLNSGETLDYAFGLFVSEIAGRRCYIHGGAWLGYRCLWIYYPVSRTTMLIFCNHGNANLHQDEVSEIFFATEERVLP